MLSRRAIAPQNRRGWRVWLPSASGPPPINDPTAIAGLAAWYRSDLGITLNAGNVSAWADQSGNSLNLNQATSTKQPPYSASGGPNNVPYILFDPTVTNFPSLLKAMTIGPPLEVFCAFRKIAINSATEYVYSFGNNFETLVHDGGLVFPAPMYMENQTDPATNLVGPYNLAQNADSIFDCYYTDNTGTSLLNVNEALQASGTFSTGHTTQRLVVGNNTGSSAVTGYMWFYELAAWQRQLTANERIQMSRYMGNRYAIAVP